MSSFVYGGSRRSAVSQTMHGPEKRTAKRQKPCSMLATEDEEVSQQSISFLALPPELRNEIYTMVAGSDSTITIDSRYAGKLTSASPFAVLNRQTRQEYCSILEIDASNYHAMVKDFDFSHVVAFYEHLQEAAPSESIKAQHSAAGSRALTVYLFFTADFAGEPSELLSNKWLSPNFHPSWRWRVQDNYVKVSYDVSKRAKTRWGNRDVWMKRCRPVIFRAHASYREELIKIVAALQGRSTGVAFGA